MSAIAEEIKRGLVEASTELGGEQLNFCVRRVSDAPSNPIEALAGGSGFTYHDFVGIKSMISYTDPARALSGETTEVLYLDALDVIHKSDQIAEGVTSETVEVGTVFRDVSSIASIAPGGVPVLYEITTT